MIDNMLRDMTEEDFAESLSVQTDSTKASDADPNISRQQYLDSLDAQGLKAVFPNADQLQIDIDNPQQLEVFERSWAILRREIMKECPDTCDEPLLFRAPSKSGAPGKFHITITVPGWQLEPVDRIAFQAALGSDPVRELLGLIRYMRGVAEPTLFAEKK